ncbi:MAG: hypothetical protein JRG86_11230 [Deltaproteobacteria bacterium]|nr:hypothetical protein [Deltaproteobacteria bacterium]
MSKHRLVVFTNAMPGRDDEFNKWYDEVHLREVVEVDGFVAAQRFVLSADQIGELDADSVPGRYLAIYEIEADDLKSAFDKLNAASGGSMTMSDALDSSSAKAIAYTALGERYTG